MAIVRDKTMPLQLIVVTDEAAQGPQEMREPLTVDELLELARIILGEPSEPAHSPPPVP